MRAVKVAGVVAALAMGALGCADQGVVSRAVVVTSTATCTEDMSCWQCETMGNQVCGAPVVGPMAEQVAADEAAVRESGAEPWECVPVDSYEMPDGYRLVCPQH